MSTSFNSGYLEDLVTADHSLVELLNGLRLEQKNSEENTSPFYTIAVNSVTKPILDIRNIGIICKDLNSTESIIEIQSRIKHTNSLTDSFESLR